MDWGLLFHQTGIVFSEWQSQCTSCLLFATQAGACGSAELATFWTVVVDGGLLLSKSHERKALAMELLRTLLLPHLSAADIPVVLSVRFMRCMLDNLKDADSLLRKEALQLLQVGSLFYSYPVDFLSVVLLEIDGCMGVVTLYIRCFPVELKGCA